MDAAATIGPALSAACGLIASWRGSRLTWGERHELCAQLCQHPDVVQHLYRMSGQRHQDHLEYLIETAELWLDPVAGGQIDGLVTLHHQQVESGVLNQFRQRERDLHKGIFMLALRQGPRVIASLWYLAELLCVEFGDRAYPTGVKRSLQRLESVGVIEFRPGIPSPGGTRSGKVILGPLSRVPPVERSLVLDLTMTLETGVALDGYAESRRGRVHQSAYAGQGLRVEAKGTQRVPAPESRPATELLIRFIHPIQWPPRWPPRTWSTSFAGAKALVSRWAVGGSNPEPAD
jgi:hypothetical protein